jgi:hypothetical protein
VSSSVPFAPERFRKSQDRTAMAEGWEVRTESGNAVKRKQFANAFVPAFPLRILDAVVQARATAALPLILVIHRQLKMTRRASTPLNPTLWKRVGSPSQRRRETILSRLRSVPDVVRLEERRTYDARYRVSRGSLWDAIAGIDSRLGVDGCD